MESPGKDMRELEAQLDRLGTHQKLPGLQVTFADTGSGSATEAAGSTGDGAAGGAEKKELTKAERKALFEAQRAAQGGGDEKKALSKAERRAQQEAQRQAKGGAPVGKDAGEKSAQLERPAPIMVTRTPSSSKMLDGEPGKGSAGTRLQFDDPRAMAKAKRSQAVQRTEVQKKVPWFSHLPQYEREASLSARLTQSADGAIHPEVLKLGLKFAEWMIVGGNARTKSMLMTFSKVVADYIPPKGHETGTDMARNLDGRLKPMISYLVACRPLSIGMGNAIRWLKGRIAHVPPELPIAKAKEHITDQIETYIQEKIVVADWIISRHGAAKIKHGDVVLVFAASSAAEASIMRAHREGTAFSVICVDSRPKLEGKKLLERLDAAGVQVTYIMLNALSYVMRDVTLVLLGASAVLANGNVISRVGTATVALMARQFNVPVLVCCETYKFSEKVMLDSICNNELADPDELVTAPLAAWRDMGAMKLLNLVYDLTPADLITLVITELGYLPPTSVPVVIREYRKEVTL